MATTDWGELRNTAALAIEALTPGSQSTSLFRLTDTERADFRDHAEAIGDACFRQFDIVPGGTTFPNTEDNQIQRRETEFTIYVAYPHSWGLYATGGDQVDTKRIRNWHALVNILEADVNQIMNTVCRRGADNYVSGQAAALEDSWDLERREGVTFGVIAGRAIYDYDAT